MTINTMNKRRKRLNINIVANCQVRYAEQDCPTLQFQNEVSMHRQKYFLKEMSSTKNNFPVVNNRYQK